MVHDEIKLFTDRRLRGRGLSEFLHLFFFAPDSLSLPVWAETVDAFQEKLCGLIGDNKGH